MSSARAMAACVVLAMGAHAALLIHKDGSAGHPAPAAGATAMLVRMQPAEQPVAAPTTAASVEPPTAETPPAPPPSPAATQPSPQVEAPPAFDGELPSIGFPDAPLPNGGADVRAYVVIDDQGATQAVSTAAPPQQPVAFQKLAEQALRQARLHVSQATAYCLLVRFEPDAPAATLAWLPGAAKDPARCLAGALPAPREIVTAAP